MSDDRYLQSLGIKPDAEARELLFVVREEEAANIGVLSDNTKKENGVSRGARGRWLPGQSGNPAGRKSRQYEKDMIDAVRRALTPENIESWINRALELADSQNSARGIVAVLELGLAYGAGKPVQQVVRDTGKTELLQELLSNDAPLLPPEPEPTETQDKNG